MLASYAAVWAKALRARYSLRSSSRALSALVHLPRHQGVVGGVHDDRDASPVLGRSPQKRDPAYVDHFDRRLERNGYRLHTTRPIGSMPCRARSSRCLGSSRSARMPRGGEGGGFSPGRPAFPANRHRFDGLVSSRLLREQPPSSRWPPARTRRPPARRRNPPARSCRKPKAVPSHQCLLLSSPASPGSVGAGPGSARWFGVEPALNGLDPLVKGLLCVAGRTGTSCWARTGPSSTRSVARWTVVPLRSRPRPARPARRASP